MAWSSATQSLMGDLTPAIARRMEQKRVASPGLSAGYAPNNPNAPTGGGAQTTKTNLSMGDAGGVRVGSYSPSVFTGRQDYAGSPNNPNDPAYVDPMAKFDAQFESTLNDLRRQQAQAASNLDLAKQRDIENRGRFERGIGIDQERSLDEARDRMASQGILRSGIAVEHAGDIGRGYQNRLDEYNRNINLAQEERQRAYEQTVRGIQDAIAQAQQQRAVRAEDVETQRAQQQAASLANAERMFATDVGNIQPLAQYFTNVGGSRYIRNPDGTFQLVSA